MSGGKTKHNFGDSVGIANQRNETRKLVLHANGLKPKELFVDSAVSQITVPLEALPTKKRGETSQKAK